MAMMMVMIKMVVIMMMMMMVMKTMMTPDVWQSNGNSANGKKICEDHVGDHYHEDSYNEGGLIAFL